MGRAGNQGPADHPDEAVARSVGRDLDRSRGGIPLRFGKMWVGTVVGVRESSMVGVVMVFLPVPAAHTRLGDA